MDIVLAYPDHIEQAAAFATVVGSHLSLLDIHTFPDGETLVQISEDVEGKNITIFCSLNDPDRKAMALMFAAQTAKDLGASHVGLVAPYLGYMRQDKRFKAGQAITADIFADFVSRYFDYLITIDPHLHRHKTLGEIYAIPATALHAADAIAGWIKQNVEQPVLVGPDEESGQWVADVASHAGAQFTVLTKNRHGDKDVEVSAPHLEAFAGFTPVLVDDIISTARTMIETVGHLKTAGMLPAVCIGTHAVFAGTAYQDLQNAGVKDIVTCNTIPHSTNRIDVTEILASGLRHSHGSAWPGR